jgi:hypothetical protein
MDTVSAYENCGRFCRAIFKLECNFIVCFGENSVDFGVEEDGNAPFFDEGYHFLEYNMAVYAEGFISVALLVTEEVFTFQFSSPIHKCKAFEAIAFFYNP